MLRKKSSVATKLLKFKRREKKKSWQPNCRKWEGKRKKKKKRVVFYSSTLTLVDPCTAFLKNAGKVKKIHHNNNFFLRIIIIYIYIYIYIYSNIAALVQYYSSKGKLNANSLFFGNFLLFWIYLLLFDCDATIFFFLFIFDNLVVIILFFFSLIFGNLVAIVGFFLSSTSSLATLSI